MGELMTLGVRGGAGPSRSAFLNGGFRPFFLLPPIYGALVVAAWIAHLTNVLPLPLVLPWAGTTWHGHEMLFGFVAGGVSGFLLTAVPKWTGTPPLTGAPLLALVLAWGLGRLAIGGFYFGHGRSGVGLRDLARDIGLSLAQCPGARGRRS
jgi:uncharacterized protein involved in response to NO